MIIVEYKFTKREFMLYSLIRMTEASNDITINIDIYWFFNRDTNLTIFAYIQILKLLALYKTSYLCIENSLWGTVSFF